MMQQELVMYTRIFPCPFVRSAQKVLQQYNVAYREIYIDQDPQARARVETWTGFAAVPTLILARPGEDFPIGEPVVLPPGSSPRGINRGTMITEPSEEQLIAWLRQQGVIA